MDILTLRHNLPQIPCNLEDPFSLVTTYDRNLRNSFGGIFKFIWKTASETWQEDDLSRNLKVNDMTTKRE